MSRDVKRCQEMSRDVKRCQEMSDVKSCEASGALTDSFFPTAVAVAILSSAEESTATFSRTSQSTGSRVVTVVTQMYPTQRTQPTQPTPPKGRLRAYSSQKGDLTQKWWLKKPGSVLMALDAYFTLILWSLHKRFCLEQTAFLCKRPAGQEEVARNVLPLELQPGAQIHVAFIHAEQSAGDFNGGAGFIKPISSLCQTWQASQWLGSCRFILSTWAESTLQNLGQTHPDTETRMPWVVTYSPVLSATQSTVSSLKQSSKHTKTQLKVERCAQAKRSALGCLGLPSSQSCFRFVPRTSSRLSAVVKHALKSTVSCSSNTPVGLTGFGAKGPASRTSLLYLVGALEPWNFMTFHILGIINNNHYDHPNWRSHIFQRDRAQPPTRYDFWPFMAESLRFQEWMRMGAPMEFIAFHILVPYKGPLCVWTICCFVEAQYSSLFGWDSWIAAFRFWLSDVPKAL